MPDGSDALQSLVQETCGERTVPEPETSTCRVRWTMGGAIESSCRDAPEQARPKAPATAATDPDRIGASGRGSPDEKFAPPGAQAPVRRSAAGIRCRDRRC